MRLRFGLAGIDFVIMTLIFSFYSLYTGTIDEAPWPRWLSTAKSIEKILFSRQTGSYLTIAHFGRRTSCDRNRNERVKTRRCPWTFSRVRCNRLFVVSAVGRRSWSITTYARVWIARKRRIGNTDQRSCSVRNLIIFFRYRSGRTVVVVVHVSFK